MRRFIGCHRTRLTCPTILDIVTLTKDETHIARDTYSLVIRNSITYFLNERLIEQLIKCHLFSEDFFYIKATLHVPLYDI